MITIMSCHLCHCGTFSWGFKNFLLGHIGGIDDRYRWTMTFFDSSLQDLLGMMYFWNIGVSTVSLVNLLLCLGLAVDACAHITHSFNEILYKTGDSREAVITALSTV